MKRLICKWFEIYQPDIKIESPSTCRCSILYGVSSEGEAELKLRKLALAKDGFGWIVDNSVLPDLINDMRHKGLIIS